MSNWRSDIVQALRNIGGQGSLAEIYEAVQAVRPKPLPRTWRAIVRKELEYNSSDSESFQERYDLFKSVDGIGNGVWALRQNATEPAKTLGVESPLIDSNSGRPKLSQSPAIAASPIGTLPIGGPSPQIPDATDSGNTAEFSSSDWTGVRSAAVVGSEICIMAPAILDQLSQWIRYLESRNDPSPLEGMPTDLREQLVELHQTIGELLEVSANNPDQLKEAYLRQIIALSSKCLSPVVKFGKYFMSGIPLEGSAALTAFGTFSILSSGFGYSELSSLGIATVVGTGHVARKTHEDKDKSN